METDGAASAEYLAGVFDVRGNFDLSHRFRGPSHIEQWNIAVSVNLPDRRLLEHLKARFGGTIGRPSKATLSHRWKIGTAGAARFLAYVFPHLRWRRDEAAVVLLLQQSIEFNRQRSITKPLREYRNALVEKMRTLKKLHARARGSPRPNLRATAAAP